MAFAAEDFETILAEVTDRTGVITVNRPEKRNALSRTVLSEISAVLDAWQDDPAVQAVVFTGAGEKAFVAGADTDQRTGLLLERLAQTLLYTTEASGRPAQVCNMHFFNPALVMKAVEIVRHGGTGADSTATGDATVATATAVVEAMGKQPVLLTKEVPGFVANRLLWAIRAEALDLVANDVASYQDIDAAAKTALGHPMGSFELMDLLGIEVTYDIRQAAYEITGDEKDKPHPLIAEKYAAGDYGRKTGKGWYSYE